MDGVQGIADFEQRKREHIAFALDPAHQASRTLERVTLLHDALPQIDFSEVTLQSSFLNRAVNTPFVVTGMTAGHADALPINARLAKVCAERGWIFGVGSQRKELSTSAGLGRVADAWSGLRETHPGLVMVGNLGLSQLAELSDSTLYRITQNFDALAIHLNSLQEALQIGGTPRFRHGIEALQRLVSVLPIPLILKETGCGFSKFTLNKLKQANLIQAPAANPTAKGLFAIDLSGQGGTHWGRIEGSRSPSTSVEALAAQTFRDWGVSTLDSLLNAADAFGSDPRPEIWASGGIRSGLDAAKCFALGADRVGYAQPALVAALQGDSALRAWMERQEFELRLALFCTGSAQIQSLKKKKDACKISAN